MRILYVEPGASRQNTPEASKLVIISPLTRQLILDAARPADGRSPGGRLDHLIALIFDELATLGEQPLRLPMPTDPRLKRLCEGLLANPEDARKLDEWADEVGATGRTLARLFKRETEMRFIDWRNQVRLARAIALLAEGLPVAKVARRLCYNTAPSLR